MILDDFRNLGQYYGICKGLDLIIEQMDSFDFKSMANGRHEIDGDRVFLNLMQTNLGQGGTWEAHRKYIDLQLVLEQEETIAWAPLNAIQDFSGYDEQKDILLSADPHKGVPMLLKAGMFGIYFPEDAHQPGIGAGQGRKAVFKIKVDEVDASKVDDGSGLTHKGSAVIKTSRMTLRPYQAGDEQAMFDNWCGRVELGRFLPWAPHKDIQVTKMVLSDWLKAYQSPKTYQWALEKDGQLIGDIAVMNQSPQNLSCEIGYCLSPDYWNQGLMTEALIEVMRFLFTKVGFHRIVLRHVADNPASGKVMQKAGLLLEGNHRQSARHPNGVLVDAIYYAAIKDEWMKKHDRS